MSLFTEENITSSIHSPLSDYIAGLHVHTFEETDHAREVRLSPDGHIELVLQFGSFSQRAVGSSEWITRPDAFVGGLHHTAFEIRANDPKGKLVGIRFRPGAAHHFLRENLMGIRNQIISLDTLFGTRGTFLQDEMLSTSGKDITEPLFSFLSDAYADVKPSLITESVSLIFQKKGCIRVAELAELACLSKARFRRRFCEEMGMAPKAYCRIIRIHSVLNYLKAQPNVSLTRVAYGFGYADQSHFIKDFKGVMGCSPKYAFL